LKPAGRILSRVAASLGLGTAGLLFPARSVDALTVAVKDFLTCSTDELRIICDAARAHILDRHSVDAKG
jgi:hypothetical protein